MIYRSLKVQPVIQGDSLLVDIQNVGNVDLELLMLDVYVPETVSQGNKFGAGIGVTMHQALRDGIVYRDYACCSVRGAFDNIVPILRPIVTPSMGPIRPSIEIPIRTGLSEEHNGLSIYIQVHAIGYRTLEERFRISEIPSWS